MALPLYADTKKETSGVPAVKSTGLPTYNAPALIAPKIVEPIMVEPYKPIAKPDPTNFFSKSLQAIESAASAVGGKVKSVWDHLTEPTVTVDGIKMPIAKPKKPGESMDFPIIGSQITPAEISSKSQTLNETADLLHSMERTLNKSDQKAIDKFNEHVTQYKADVEAYNKDLTDYNFSQTFNASQIYKEDPGTLRTISNNISKLVSDVLINIPADLLSETKYFKDVGLGLNLQEEKTQKTGKTDMGADFAQDMLRRLSLLTKSVSGATAGIVNIEQPPQPAELDLTDKIISMFAQGVGMAAGLGKIEGAISPAVSSIPGLSTLATKLPLVGKYAVPFIRTASAFAIYGQASQTLDNASLGQRLKIAGIDFVKAVPYFALGLTKKAWVSIPASGLLGYGSAKLEGASNEDALASGIGFMALDGFARASAPAGADYKRGIIGQKEVRFSLRKEAVDVMNKFSDTKITTDSSLAEVKKAFFEAARKTHPDKTGGNDTDFKRVNAARDILDPRENVQDNKIDEEVNADVAKAKAEEPSPVARAAEEAMAEVKQSTTKSEASTTAPETVGVRPEDLEASIDQIFAGAKQTKEKMKADAVTETQSKEKTPKTEKSTAFDRENYIASQVGEPKEGYTRYEITLKGGENIFADFKPDTYASQSHVEFHSKEAGPNPVSDTGYKSHFSTYSSKGKTPEEIETDITDLANEMAKENKPAKPKKLPEYKETPKERKAQTVKKKKTKEPEPYKTVNDQATDKMVELEKKVTDAPEGYQKKTAEKAVSAQAKKITELGKEKAITTTIDNKEVSRGDFVQFGPSRVMIFDSVRSNGKYLLSDPEGGRGYELLVKKDDVSIPSKDRVTSEYERVGWPKNTGFEEALNKLEPAKLEMEEGEKNAYGNLTNPDTMPALEKLSEKVTMENLQEVAKTFDNENDFSQTTGNFLIEQGGKKYDQMLKLLENTKSTMGSVFDSVIDNEAGNSRINSDDRNNRQNEISDTGELPARDNSDLSRKATGEVPGYDRATMLAQFGDGPSSAGTASISKKGRQLINQEVESLLEARDYSTNPDDYAQDDHQLMMAYTGAGGKESVGAEGAGLLNEYYTPPKVIEKIWDIVKKIAPDAETAFEPSAGTGRFISLSPVEIKVDGVEISKTSGTIASVLNPDSDITIGDFQELFFDKKTNKQKEITQYDVVIGNPPFGDRAGFLKGKGEESKIGREEEYFIKRGLNMVKDGGHLVYVVNSSFLKTGTSAGKIAISANGKLVAAYRLPENSFEDTSIGTDIVVFEKLPDEKADLGPVRAGTLRDDMYFRAHPENVLGETKIRRNRFGQTETYVKGNLEDALAKIDTSLLISSKTEDKKTITPQGKKVISKRTAVKTEDKAVKISQVTKPTENAGDKIIPLQSVSNKTDYSPIEVNMLKRIDRDLAVPNPTPDEMPYLNYAGNEYFSDGIYFAGEIYQKLTQLENDKENIIKEFGEDQYEKQKKGLEAIIPKTIPIKDIAFDPIDRHVADVQTADEEGNKMSVLSAFNSYIRRNDVALSPRVSKWDVMRYVQGEQASKGSKPIMGYIKSDAKRLFNHFLKNELAPETQKEIETKYNHEKNGYVQPDYTKIPVEIKDMSKQFRGEDFHLSDTQKNGVGFLVNKGSGLIAYGVGVGKTHTLAIATVANMQKGWSKRPLFVVPKSTINKTWIATLKEMFPTLTINNLEGLQAPVIARLKREKGDNKAEWINDGELSVISHEGLLRLGLNEEQLRQATGDLKDALWIEPKTKRGGEKTKSVYDEIAGNAQKYVTDVMMSDLGFDHLSVDEVHNFRKVFQGAKAEKTDDEGKAIGKKRYANILGGTPSRRAQQLFLLSQYVQKNNNNRNVFLASATPFENHATEVYNILSFIARDRMRNMGLMNINDFFASFANFEVELDRKLDGEWINREKMKSFSNLPTLQNLLKEFIDYQEDPTLVRPDRKVLTPHLQMSEMQIQNLTRIQSLLTGVKDEAEDTQEFDEESKAFYDVADSMSSKDVEDGAFLKASTYSIANSVSPFFIKEYTKTPPSAKKLVEESPKIQYAIETLRTLKNDPKTKDFGTFIFFGKMGVEYHPMIADYITKELGYKDGEVAVLSGDVSDDEKEDIKEKFNDGRVKVLLGGDQTKEGIDLQYNGFVTINLALGWNPTQISQVEGRVWRQGNRRSIAPLIYPLVENSGDSTIFNKFEEKGGRINDLFSYKGKMFDVGEIDPAEKKLALLTDPKDKAKMQIEIDKTATYNERLLLENDIKEIRALQADLTQTTEDMNYYQKQLDEGMDQYGNTLTEAEIKEYKKEIKTNTDRQTRLNSKLEAKNITDVNQSINDLEVKIVEADQRIKEIGETYEEKLKIFTEQYREDVKNRKTLADHMKEIQSLVNEVQERSPEEIKLIREKKIADVEEARRASMPEFQRIEKSALTLKTLDRLGDRKTVSRQFIADLARKADIKKVEKDLIEKLLEGEPATVDVQAFTKKVVAELLPLTVVTSKDGEPIYEQVVLPSSVRGDVAEYYENIYESPIKTSAGAIHFGNHGDGSENYFGHTRVEDMQDLYTDENGGLAEKQETRRVIEVQSDLYQKRDVAEQTRLDSARRVMQYNNEELSNPETTQERKDFLEEHNKELQEMIKEDSKLEQYNDPTAHFRMVREEIKKAAEDSKTKLQFPTGETAMKIEGLGENSVWASKPEGGPYIIDEEWIKDRGVGTEIYDGAGMEWIITDVLGEGKFKAIQKDILNDNAIEILGKGDKYKLNQPDFAKIVNYSETFDISGKIDTNNPIYKFYENELGKYLKNKYGVTLVTDAQGITWWEVKPKPEMAGPVEAFQKETGVGERHISFEEAKDRLEAYKERLKLDFDVDFAHAIFTGGANNERAYAVTYNNKISLTDNVRATTADHEMVHLVMNNLSKIPAFEGISRDQLLKAANGGKAYSAIDENALNEKIAEGFQEFINGTEQSSIPNVLLRFFEKLKALWTNFLRALGTEIDPIQDFYNRLFVAHGKEEVALESQKALDQQVQFNTERGPVMAFNQARALYLRKTRADFEKIVNEEAKSHSINLRKKDINFFDSLFAQSRDLFLKDKTEFKQADELMKIGDERRMKKAILDTKFADMLEPYFGMKVSDKAKVNEVLMQGDEVGEEYSDAKLRDMGLTQTQIDGYKATRQSFNVAHELLLSEMEANGVKEEEIDTFRKERVGYMPHKWKYRFAIKTQSLKPGGDPAEASSWRTETMDVYRTAREADKAFAELNKNNAKPEEVRYVNDTLDSLEVDFFSEQRFSFENMKSIISKAKMASDVREEMMIGLRNMIKEKGFGRNFIRRTGIQGYEKKEVPKIIADYFAGLNGFITKMEAGKKYYGVLEKIDARRQKRFYSWVRDSIAYDMGNSKEGNALKQIAFVYHLANDLSFLLTNATQNITVGVGELSKLVPGAGKLYKGETAIIKATVDWTVGNITPEERRVIEQLVAVGRLGGEMTAELMGFKNNPVYHSISKGINKFLYNTTSFVEKNVNRVPAFLAARRLLKEQGLSDKEANEQALSVSDDINFRYGKQHRPTFMRGRKSVLFVFNHYMRSFLYQLSRDMKNKEFTSLIKKIFYIFLLGGTAALPFAGMIKNIYKWIAGPNPDEEQQATIGSFELALERGIPASYFNVDMSNRIGIDVMAISGALEGSTSGTIDNLLQVKTYLGAVGSLLIDRLPKGIDLLHQGRYLEAGGKLLPDFIGNPMKAYKGATEGIESQAGNPLIDENGDQFTYTTYEGFLKATGFTPTREQLAWDEQSRQWDLKNAQSEENSAVKDKISRMIRAGDTEGARKYQEEARKSGELNSSTDYVRKIVKDDTIRTQLDTWESGPKTQIRLDQMEKSIAKEMYGPKYTAANLTSVTEEFAFRRTFGYDDKNANDVKKSVSNADKVLVLKRIREDLGPEDFREFFNRGRKVVQYESGRSGYVLISDNLKDLYVKSK